VVVSKKRVDGGCLSIEKPQIAQLVNKSRVARRRKGKTPPSWDVSESCEHLFPKLGES
jgi:hypothetical protein